MRFGTFYGLAVLAMLAGCGERQASVEDFNSREVTLPDGAKIRVETVSKQVDILRGMQYRESLAADRGMLYLYGGLGDYPFWMYRVKIPLDIVWMNENHLITEIVPNVQPCPSTSSSKCPMFGGHRKSLYVLQLAAGSTGKHHLKLNDRLDF
jgi:uncharacterized membrane protein (UPF0127 family)